MYKVKRVNLNSEMTLLFTGLFFLVSGILIVFFLEINVQAGGCGGVLLSDKVGCYQNWP